MQCSGSIAGKRLDWRRRLQCCSRAAAPCAAPKPHCAIRSQHKRTLAAKTRISMTPKSNAQLHTTASHRGTMHHAAATTTATPAAGAPAISAAVCAGDVLVLRCERLGFEGKGICLAPPSGLVVMVDRALPGELMRVQITAVKKGEPGGSPLGVGHEMCRVWQALFKALIIAGSVAEHCWAICQVAQCI